MSVQNLSGWWLGWSTEEYLAAKDTKNKAKKNKTRTVVVRDFELNMLGTLTPGPEETLKSEEKKRME